MVRRLRNRKLAVWPQFDIDPFTFIVGDIFVLNVSLYLHVENFHIRGPKYVLWDRKGGLAIYDFKKSMSSARMD